MNYVFENQFPHALDEIRQHIKSTELDNGKSNIIPFCLHYYKFLQSNHPKKYWETISASNELKCGDLIVICEDATKITRRGQHIMMVASKMFAHAYPWARCQVYDSVRYGHGLDERSPNGENGVGEGQIALRVEAGKIVEIKWGISDQSTRYSKFIIARVKNSLV